MREVEVRSRPVQSGEEEQVSLSAAHEFVYRPMAEIVGRTLVQAGAFVVAEEIAVDKFFRWKSGVEAPVYTDCRVIQGHPGSTKTTVSALSRSVENSFDCDAVVGMAEGGIVWSFGVAFQLGLPHAFARKQLKEHGRGRMVEGCLTEYDRVVLVDDLMAGGGTAVKAIGDIEKETGAHVVGVQTIVNWGFSEMRDRFNELNVPFRALVSYDDILDAAVIAGTLTTAAANELRAFYRNPRTHVWHLENFSLRNVRRAVASAATATPEAGEHS
jgi:orotate phosphoribosyltransferase